jgi:hypothetical protein
VAVLVVPPDASVAPEMSSGSIAVHSVVVNTTPTGGGNRAPRPDDLEQFVAEGRVDEAVRDRRRRHHLESRALEEADTTRTLLAAVDRVVTVHLTAARAPVNGTVFSIGADVVEMHTPTTIWWIALRAVAAVETDGALLGDPADRATTSLTDLACDLVDSGTPVTVVLSSGASLNGEVVAMGDALVVQLHQPERRAVVGPDHVAAITRRSPRP